MNANITVLKDESLGGIEREYREVKRKAAVGERIKISGNMGGFYEDGDIGVVFEIDGDDDAWAVFDNGEEACIGKPDSYYGYSTLELTNIVRINGTRFRMVDRKAAVGERIIVTEIVDYAMSEMTVGRSYAVVSLQSNFEEPPYVNVIDDEGDRASADQRGYRVLEPLESAETAAEPLSAKPAPDQAAEIIAKLTTRVTALEKCVAALESPKSRPATDEEVADVLAKAAESIRKTTSVSVAEVSAGLKEFARKARQRKRDDIVKRAKEDVAKLIADACGDNEGAWDELPALKFLGHVTFKFAVNRDKRKVTALAFLRHVPHVKSPRFRASAKCAPGDVFNTHIGRAISLRRALGLEIPEEYVSAPQPTEVRVGDIVKWTNTHIVDDTEVLTVTQIEGDRYWLSNGGFDDRCTLSVLDDSRESDGAEPRKEVA